MFWLQVSKCRGALWGRGEKASHEETSVQGSSECLCGHASAKGVRVSSGSSWCCVPMSSKDARLRECARMRPRRWVGTDIIRSVFPVSENMALVCGWSFVKQGATSWTVTHFCDIGKLLGDAWPKHFELEFKALCVNFSIDSLCNSDLSCSLNVSVTLRQFEKPAFTKGLAFLNLSLGRTFFPRLLSGKQNTTYDQSRPHSAATAI